jgi:hypothetical protein
MNQIKLLFALLLVVLIACNTSSNQSEKNQATMEHQKGSFQYDLDFLKQYHKDLIVLGTDNAQIIVLPQYQARIMTSTAEGNAGASFGWLNHELIASKKFSPHFSAFGGEERFWIGPEGGQFSIYFKKGVPFSFDNWFVPKEIDTEKFEVIEVNKTSASFEKTMHLQNYSGTDFDVKVNRNIQVLTDSAIYQLIRMAPKDTKIVGFESNNSITNTGKNTWTKQSGLLSIWILSMLNANENTTIALPYKKGDSAQLGKIVTDDYFGKVPADRLQIKDGLILLKADGNHRSKIGIAPARAIPMAASYDAKNNLLTIAQFSINETDRDYVNGLWQIQKNPFAGDAVNAYNDGPIDGKQMGKFYELESSSPAAALAPGASIHHLHRTIHLKGPKQSLNDVTMKLFGVGVDALVL